MLFHWQPAQLEARNRPMIFPKDGQGCRWRVAIRWILMAGVFPALVQSGCSIRRTGDWWNPAWHFRARYESNARDAAVFTVRVNFSRLLAKSGEDRKALDENSIRVIEASSDGKILNNNPLPHSFERVADYSATHNAAGMLTWRAPKSEQQDRRIFHVYFDLESNGLKEKPVPIDDPPTLNLLSDPGFEKKPEQNPPWKIFNKKENKWTFYPVWSDTAAHSGSHSIRLETDQIARCDFETARVSVQPGVTYRMSLWFKVDSVGSGRVRPVVSFECYKSRAATNKYERLAMDDFRLVNAGDWKYVEKIVVPPAGTTELWMRFGLWQCHGAAWFDDADIRPLKFDELLAAERLGKIQKLIK